MYLYMYIYIYVSIYVYIYIYLFIYMYYSDSLDNKLFIFLNYDFFILIETVFDKAVFCSVLSCFKF